MENQITAGYRFKGQIFRELFQRVSHGGKSTARNPPAGLRRAPN